MVLGADQRARPPERGGGAAAGRVLLLGFSLKRSAVRSPLGVRAPPIVCCALEVASSRRCWRLRLYRALSRLGLCRALLVPASPRPLDGRPLASSSLRSSQR